MNRKSRLKGIRNYDKIIKEHYDKIRKEKTREFPKKEVIEYWEKEIRTLKNNRKNLDEKV